MLPSTGAAAGVMELFGTKSMDFFVSLAETKRHPRGGI